MSLRQWMDADRDAINDFAGPLLSPLLKKGERALGDPDVDQDDGSTGTAIQATDAVTSTVEIASGEDPITVPIAVGAEMGNDATRDLGVFTSDDGKPQGFLDNAIEQGGDDASKLDQDGGNHVVDSAIGTADAVGRTMVNASESEFGLAKKLWDDI